MQFLEASEHKPKMASFRALKLMEQIEGNGDGHLQQIGLMDGVDQSPVVPQPLIPKHPVHHRAGRVRVGSFLQEPDPARLDGGYGGRHSAAPVELTCAEGVREEEEGV